MYLFIHILLVLFFAKMTHQKLFCVQIHEQVDSPQTFFMFLGQCQNFTTMTFNGIAFMIDILIKITLILSFLDAFTSIVNGFELNLAKINEDGCICDSDEVTIGYERKFPIHKNNNYNYNNVNGIQHNLDSNDSIKAGIKDDGIRIGYEIQQGDYAYQQHSILTKKIHHYIERVSSNNDSCVSQKE